MKKDIKILKFEQKPKELLSSEDIMKFFAGFIRLVQKSADYRAMEKVKIKTNYYNKQINEMSKELSKRNNQIEELLQLNEELILKIRELDENKTMKSL